MGQVVKSWFTSVSPGSLCNANAFCMLVKNLPNRLTFGIYWSETAGETKLAFYFWCEEHITWRLNTLCFMWGNKILHYWLLIKAVLKKNVHIVITLLPKWNGICFYSFISTSAQYELWMTSIIQDIKIRHCIILENV